MKTYSGSAQNTVPEAYYVSLLSKNVFGKSLNILFYCNDNINAIYSLFFFQL